MAVGRTLRATTLLVALAAGMLLATSTSSAVTDAPPQLEGRNGWSTEPFFTVGEKVAGYRPTGVLDGTGAWAMPNGSARLFVNSELNSEDGYAYALANGTTMTGARTHELVVDPATLTITDAGLAYDRVYDRRGDVVTLPEQINESGHPTRGFVRLCSAHGLSTGDYGFVDDIYFTGEEAPSGHPHGGTLWAIELATGDIWAVPPVGRGAWENVTPIDTGHDDWVGFLLGDDFGGAPLYLWLGEKDAVGDGSFLDRNGLVEGQLYVWVPNSGNATPEEWNRTGRRAAGRFRPFAPRDVAMAGAAGYDDDGWKDDATMRAGAIAQGAFSFSRPEDLATDPTDGQHVVFASTGRSSLYPSDSWGTTYLIDVNLKANRLNRGAPATVPAQLTILYDGDDPDKRDFGLRSPDNLDWADDGYVYVQEDRTFGDFGDFSGEETSIWRLDPTTPGAATRIAQVDRTAIPVRQRDSDPNDLGDWETSGILDVTDKFPHPAGGTTLLVAVQAHSVGKGAIVSNNLEEGGQLLLLYSP